MLADGGHDETHCDALFLLGIDTSEYYSGPPTSTPAPTFAKKLFVHARVNFIQRPSLNRSEKFEKEVHSTCWECDVTIAKKRVEDTMERSCKEKGTDSDFVVCFTR